MAGFVLPLAMAGGAVARYIGRQAYKRPKFESTSYGKHLKKTAKTGAYSGTARSNIVGAAGRQAGNIAANERARLRGYLERQGLGGSVAGAKVMSDPGRQHMNSVLETTRDVETQNELSKHNAREAYAQARTQWRESGRQEKQGAFNELVGGLTSATATGVQNYFQSRALQEAAELAPSSIGEMSEMELLEWAAENDIDSDSAMVLWYEARGDSAASDAPESAFDRTYSVQGPRLRRLKNALPASPRSPWELRGKAKGE